MDGIPETELIFTSCKEREKNKYGAQ